MISPIYSLGMGFYTGFKGVTDNAVLENHTPIEVAFNPSVEKIINPGDTLTLNNGKMFPFTAYKGVVMIEDNDMPTAYIGLISLLTTVIIVAFIFLLVYFIRFVVSINKGRIFDSQNVKLLGKIGWSSLIISILQIAYGMTDQYSINAMHLEIDGYDLSSAWVMPWSTLLVGLVSLLMAKIWSTGLKMREEQELTI
jgi:hypothetical protein